MITITSDRFEPPINSVGFKAKFEESARQQFDIAVTVEFTQAEDILACILEEHQISGAGEDDARRLMLLWRMVYLNALGR
jgi:hypothetical protein